MYFFSHIIKYHLLAFGGQLDNINNTNLRKHRNYIMNSN